MTLTSLSLLETDEEARSMDPTVPISASTLERNGLGEPHPSRRRILHLTRGSSGRLLREILECQMEDSEITIVSLESEEDGLKAWDLEPCGEMGERSKKDRTRGIGYSELLDLILRADKVFVW